MKHAVIRLGVYISLLVALALFITFVYMIIFCKVDIVETRISQDLPVYLAIRLFIYLCFLLITFHVFLVAFYVRGKLSQMIIFAVQYSATILGLVSLIGVVSIGYDFSKATETYYREVMQKELKKAEEGLLTITARLTTAHFVPGNLSSLYEDLGLWDKFLSSRIRIGDYDKLLSLMSNKYWGDDFSRHKSYTIITKTHEKAYIFEEFDRNIMTPLSNYFYYGDLLNKVNPGTSLMESYSNYLSGVSWRYFSFFLFICAFALNVVKISCDFVVRHAKTKYIQ